MPSTNDQRKKSEKTSLENVKRELIGFDPQLYFYSGDPLLLE